MPKNYTGLERTKPAMPGFVKRALKKRGLLEKYKKRPDYQKEGYLDWINEAKIKDLQHERLNQMFDELEKGGLYLGEEYPVVSKDSKKE